MLQKVQKSRKEQGRNSPIMERTERRGRDGRWARDAGRKTRLRSFLEGGWEQNLNICRSLAAALTPAGANQELMLPLHSPTVCWKPVCCIFPAIITCSAVFNLHIHREEEGPQAGGKKWRKCVQARISLEHAC